MDMIQPDADPTALTSLLECLGIAPGRLKDLMKETTVECTKNVLALLRTYFPWLALERVGKSIAVDFYPLKLPEVAEQFNQVAEDIVKQLDL